MHRHDPGREKIHYSVVGRCMSESSAFSYTGEQLLLKARLLLAQQHSHPTNCALAAAAHSRAQNNCTAAQQHAVLLPTCRSRQCCTTPHDVKLSVVGVTSWLAQRSNSCSEAAAQHATMPVASTRHHLCHQQRTHRSTSITCICRINCVVCNPAWHAGHCRLALALKCDVCTPSTHLNTAGIRAHVVHKVHNTGHG